MTAAKTPARSSGRVQRVRNPKTDEPAPAPTPEVTEGSCQCTNPRTEAADRGLTCHEAAAQQQPLGVSQEIHEVPWKDTQNEGSGGRGYMSRHRAAILDPRTSSAARVDSRRLATESAMARPKQNLHSGIWLPSRLTRAAEKKEKWGRMNPGGQLQMHYWYILLLRGSQSHDGTRHSDKQSQGQARRSVWPVPWSRERVLTTHRRSQTGWRKGRWTWSCRCGPTRTRTGGR